MSARYSPLEFLEQSERDWADTCVALTRTFHEDGTTEGGDPHAVPFPWTRLLERLRTPEERVLVPPIIGHFLTCARAGEAETEVPPPPPQEAGLRAGARASRL